MVPTVLVAIFSYLIGSLFISVYSFSCTSILHCFVLDRETGESDLAPKSLDKFLEYIDS